MPFSQFLRKTPGVKDLDCDMVTYDENYTKVISVCEASPDRYKNWWVTRRLGGWLNCPAMRVRYDPDDMQHRLPIGVWVWTPSQGTIISEPDTCWDFFFALREQLRDGLI